MQEQEVDIAIVGAGLVGSALAIWLAQHTNYRIALVERNAALSKPDQANRRVVALGRLATDLLTDIGVFQTLDKLHCYPYQSMHVWDESSNGELNFDASLLDSEESLSAISIAAGVQSSSDSSRTPLGHMVDSLYCNYACQQNAINNIAIDTYFDADLRSLDRVNQSNKLLGKEFEISAQLVIAADGANSWLRQTSKIFANHHDYQQRGIVTRIITEKSHQDCAWQRFLGSGPVAVLPLENNQSSIVWSAENSLAEELLALSDREFEARLQHALQNRLGRVTVLAERLGFPLKSVRAETYYKCGLVLVGDAAHSIHPLAGQGANLGFKDAQYLGQLIVEADNGRNLSCPRLLARYQRKRQADNNQTDALMSALHHTYQNNWPLWMAARGMGMNMLNRTELVRRLFIEQATGA